MTPLFQTTRLAFYLHTETHIHFLLGIHRGQGDEKAGQGRAVSRRNLSSGREADLREEVKWRVEGYPDWVGWGTQTGSGRVPRLGRVALVGSRVGYDCYYSNENLF